MTWTMRTLSLPGDGSAGARRPRAFIVIVIASSPSLTHGHVTSLTITSLHHRRLSPSLPLQNAIAEENQLLSGAESQQAEVRVAFGEGVPADQQAAASDDQQTAAQTNAASIDEITLDDADNSEENRNKR